MERLLSTEQREVLHKPRRVYVEVGVGYTIGYSDDKAFSPGDIYIGIENGYAHSEGQLGTRSTETGFATAREATNFTHPPTVEFAVADGRNLPLSDESTDEVLLANVFSDPLTAPLIRTTESKGTNLITDIFGNPSIVVQNGEPYHLRDELGEMRKALLEEAVRVTKVGGRIVINSYITVSYVNHEKLLNWLQVHRFRVESLSPNSTEWSKKAAGYFPDASRDQRLLIATKEYGPDDRPRWFF